MTDISTSSDISCIHPPIFILYSIHVPLLFPVMNKRQKTDSDPTDIKSLDEEDDMPPSIVLPMDTWLVRTITTEEANGMDMTHGLFRLHRNSKGNRPNIAIDKKWLIKVSGFMQGMNACNDQSTLGVQNIPDQCDEMGFVLFLGLLAASSGDTGFLPTFKSGYIEIQGTLNVCWDTVKFPCINLFNGKKCVDLRPVAAYFMVDPMALQRCYVQTMPRIFHTGGCLGLAESVLFCIPVSALEATFSKSLNAVALIDFFYVHPKADARVVPWHAISYETAEEISKILQENHIVFKSIESIASMSMLLSPVLAILTSAHHFRTFRF